MEQLQILKADALKAYRNADYNGKELLKELFGESITEKVTDKITSFEEACKVLNIKPEDVLHSAHSSYLQKHINSINAYCKLIVITEALNEGWTPDWDNEDEYKHYPWFYMSASGFRFNDATYDCDSSDVGSRLCFHSAELAQYAANQFLDIYKEFMTI